MVTKRSPKITHRRPVLPRADSRLPIRWALIIAVGSAVGIVTGFAINLAAGLTTGIAVAAGLHKMIA